MPGVGEPTVKIYHSLVQYHCPTPYFNETIKLCIPPDMMKTARIRFYMYHKPTTICEGGGGRSVREVLARLWERED